MEIKVVLGVFWVLIMPSFNHELNDNKYSYPERYLLEPHEQHSKGNRANNGVRTRCGARWVLEVSGRTL